MAKKKDLKKNPPMKNRDISVPKEELDALLRRMLESIPCGEKDI